jgi:multidrug efflux pump subunit AcrA (membrane-fusion protein)
MKLKILAIVVLAAVGVGAAFVTLGGLPASAASTTQYLTGAVATGDVADDVAATGTVATTASYGVAFGAPTHLAGATTAAGGASTTWTTTKVSVKVGDTVKKGAILATASTTDLERQLADASAALGSAKIQQTIATEDLAAATTTAATRQAQMNLYNADTQVSNARQSKIDLVNQIALATLKAPVDGLVTAVNIGAGLEAPSGDAIVIDATTFQVTADVVESDLSAMAVGQAASTSIGAVDDDRQHDRRRRLVRGHGLARQPAGHGPRRDDGERHDHDRQRHERPDRPRRGPARHGRRLYRADPRCGRDPDRPGGPGRSGHQHHGRDQEWPQRR